MTEDPSAGLGKWALAGVPHRGWTCVAFDDLGQPDLVCEMCETQAIRYVHFMQHPDYPGTLACGCICAGHMEQDIAGARHREATAINAARRRAGWLDRKGWRRNVRGHLRIRTDGFRIVIFRRGSGYGGVISTQGFERFSRKTYPTEAAAQLAALDAMLLLKSRQH